MSRSENIIRLVAATLATLVAVMFVHGYTWIKYHNLVEHMDCTLPAHTLFIATVASWTYVVSAAVFVCGIVLFRWDTSVRIIFAVAWLLALAWPLACILSWETPLILL